jgi:hypothetical protein
MYIWIAAAKFITNSHRNARRRCFSATGTATDIERSIFCTRKADREMAIREKTQDALFLNVF